MANYAKTKDVKNNIMNSAHELFSVHGVDNVKVIDIAEDAGVAKGLVFYHFTSKDGLVNDILYSHFCNRFSVLMNIEKSPRPDIILFEIFNKMFNPSGPLHICDGYFEGDVPDKYHMAIDRARQDTVLPAMLQLILDGIEYGLFDIVEPEISFEIMSRGFDNFLHVNTRKFADPVYHKKFLKSAEHLLDATLRPTKTSFHFEHETPPKNDD